MKSKNLIIVIIIFVGLMGLAVLKKNARPKQNILPTHTDLITAPVGTSQVSEVVLRIGSAGEQVHFFYDKDNWRVKSHYGVYADVAKLDVLLSKLDRLGGEPRSDSQTLLSDYGIEDEEAVHIILRNKTSELAHLVVGAKKAGYNNNFVRKAGHNTVYFVEENVLSDLGFWQEVTAENFDTDRWLDKHPLRFDPENVISLTITKSSQGEVKPMIQVLRKTIDGKKKWETPVPHSSGLSARKIKDFIGQAKGLTAAKVVGIDKKGVFNTFVWKAEIGLADGQQLNLTRGDKDESNQNYYVKTDVADYYYLMPVSAFDSFVEKSNDIFEDTPVEAEVKESATELKNDIPTNEAK